VRLHDHPRSSNAQKVRLLLGVLECERRTVSFEAALPCAATAGALAAWRSVATESGVTA
jgi:glutathione S-transferase